MRPAWSIIVFTTLAGAGQGLFLALFATDLAGRAARHFLFIGSAIAAILCLAGLASSFFHLGRPSRSWRSAAMWRTSWLSREVIVLPAFIAAVAGYSAAQLFSMHDLARALGWIAVVLCLALFVCTAMIYACLKFLQEWHSPLTFVNFFALGCASGATAAAALAAELQPALLPSYTALAIALGLMAFATRILFFWRNARLHPRSTTQSAIGVRNPKVRQISQGQMGGSYNTREFFHGRSAATVTAVRAAFLILGFPLHAVLLYAGQPAIAFVVQYAGLLAERWLFFADARHPQNLYYQSIA